LHRAVDPERDRARDDAAEDREEQARRHHAAGLHEGREHEAQQAGEGRLRDAALQERFAPSVHRCASSPVPCVPVLAVTVPRAIFQ
jgi:hypothetical protein